MAHSQEMVSLVLAPDIERHWGDSEWSLGVWWAANHRDLNGAFSGRPLRQVKHSLGSSIESTTWMWSDLNNTKHTQGIVLLEALFSNLPKMNIFKSEICM